MSVISNSIPSSTSTFMISETIFRITSAFNGTPFIVVSISIVVRLSIPIIEDIRSPPLITKLNLYLDFDSLSKNLSKKNICRTSCDLRFLECAIFLILPFKLSELIIYSTSVYFLISSSMPRTLLYLIRFLIFLSLLLKYLVIAPINICLSIFFLSETISQIHLSML